MTLRFAQRLEACETSAIRDLFKHLAQPGMISFAGGFPDASTFDVEGLREAANTALAQEPSGALQYGATEGYEPLRSELATLMAARGMSVATDGFIVTTGSQQALDLLGKCLVSPGDKVVVEGPTFLAAIQCFRMYGAQLLSAPVDAQGVDMQRLEELLRRHRPKLVYLIPNFGNPSGALLSLERRRQVLQLAVQYDTLVIEDDPYGELYFDAAPPPSLLALSEGVPGSRDLLAYCGSLSKVLAPGLRLGWLVAPAALLAKATLCKQFSDAHTSTFAQATGARYLASGRLEPQLQRVRDIYAQRAAAMDEALRHEFGAELAYARPRGGMFFWARLNDGADAGALARRGLAQSVAIVPGAPFYAQDADRATFRLSFATTEVERIGEGLARLRRA